MAASSTTGKEALVAAARRLFAEASVEAVSLREVARSAGQRNTNAVQYHFGDRQTLLRAVVDPLEAEVSARRAALLDELELQIDPPPRAFAGALVRPSAAMLERPEGREHLRVVAELIGDLQLFGSVVGPELSGLARWSERAKAEMPEETLPLHRRYSAMSLCFHELARRAAGPVRSDHRLFVSDLVDLVTGVLSAPVSEESKRLLDERPPRPKRRAS